MLGGCAAYVHSRLSAFAAIALPMYTRQTLVILRISFVKHLQKNIIGYDEWM